MDIGTFWVGEKPGRVFNIRVKDAYGNNMNLAPYTNVEIEMLDTNNRKVDLTGAQTSRIDPATGLVGFVFPSDRSVFKKAGEYLIRLRLENSNSLDFTGVTGIRVKEFGGTRF